MSYPIYNIVGIGPAIAETLAKDSIKTTAVLLDTCASAKGREEVGK